MAGKTVHTAAAMGIAGGLFLTAVGLIFAPAMLRAMNTTDDVIDLAITYLRIYFTGMVFNLLYNIGSSILRAVGDSKRPLYFLAITTVANLAAGPAVCACI